MADVQVPRRARLLACYWAWLANIVLGAIIGQRWLAHSSRSGELAAEFFMQGALVSTLAMIGALVFLPLCILAFAIPSVRVLAALHAVLWTLFLVLLYADTVIYGMFRYHFNGLVWHELTTPGSEDAIHLDARLWLQVGAVALVVGLGQWWFWTWCARRTQTARAPQSRWFKRPAWIAGLCLFAAILGEKGTYAYADMTRNRSVMARSRLFPLYQPLTIKRLIGKKMGYDLSKRERVELAGAGVLIQYPLERPRLPADGPRPNVLIVVIDSLRRDMLTAEVSPQLTRWSAGGRRFQQHLSGGNATRFGIFSLVYGLHGSYWPSILNEQAPPVLVTSLMEAGYEPRVMSAASMNSPEFRSTCWVTIEDQVFDKHEGQEKYVRDQLVAKNFEDWLAVRDAKQPFFAFALLDSPHQTYSVDPALTPFQPYEERVDYLKMGGEPDAGLIARVKNRYMNACASADAVAGRMLAALERHGLAENTIVVVTGDHGEEFYEHGHFGHTSNYTPEQTWVSFAMRGPGIEPGEEQRPTSHIDLAPTLLEMLGVAPALRPRYSLGTNLFDPNPTRLRVIAGWQELALWRDGGILYIPMEGHKGLVEGYGYDWKPLEDETELLRSGAGALQELSEECRRFLR